MHLAWISVVLLVILVGGYPAARRWFGHSGGITILGYRYSEKTAELFDQVQMLYNKPVHVVQPGQIPENLKSRFLPNAKNAIYTSGDEILLLLQKGAPEDVVTHELMHAILRAEGYPDLWGIGVTPLGQKVGVLVAGMLDHLCINQRLAEVGYDARAGFLSEADGPDNLLKIDVPKEPAGRLIFCLLMLEQLVKFHHYIGDTHAEAMLLTRFPEVAPYWRTLSSQIESLPQRPTPGDLWNIGVTYIQLGDNISTDLNAGLRVSDLVGLGPVILHEGDLSKSAKSIFTQTTEPLNAQQVTIRIFLKEPRVMVWRVVAPTGSGVVNAPQELCVRDYLRELSIDHRVVR